MEDLMRKRKLRRSNRLVGGVLYGGVSLRCPLEGDSLLFASLLFVYLLLGALHPIPSELILKLEMRMEELEEEEVVVVVEEVVVEEEEEEAVADFLLLLH
jgi:hypothetical protein